MERSGATQNETGDSHGHKKEDHLKKRLNSSSRDKNSDKASCPPDSEDDEVPDVFGNIGATSIKSATMNMITQASRHNHTFFSFQ
jgi:hypothetical protein